MTTSKTVPLGFLALMLASAAEADNVERRGFVIGLGAGIGQTRIEGESNTAVAGEFHLGAMVGEKTAVILDGSAVTDSEEGVTLSIGLGALAIQHWVHDRLWVKAGIGSGFSYVTGGGESESEDLGLGFVLGAGYEIVQTGNFTLDLQGRFTTSSKENVRFNNFSAVIAVNWW